MRLGVALSTVKQVLLQILADGEELAARLVAGSVDTIGAGHTTVQRS